MAETMTLREKAEAVVNEERLHYSDVSPDFVDFACEVAQAYLESLPPADDEESRGELLAIIREWPTERLLVIVEKEHGQ